MFTADSRMYRTAIDGIKKLKQKGKVYCDSEGNKFNINETKLSHLADMAAWNSSVRKNSIRLKFSDEVLMLQNGWKGMDSVQKVNYWNTNISNKKFEFWIEVTVK